MITIWHNPRCSKSRQTLDLLKREGHNPVVRLYLDNPPSETELRAAQSALGLPAISMMRTGEAAFKEQGLAKTDAETTLISAMATTPKLIERPVVFCGARARIGRPPEAVMDIL
ncbi:MAG: arsenate reductase (glutaredoxin) [Roseovarius sp.]